MIPVENVKNMSSLMENRRTISFYSLFNLASRKDIIFIAIGTISSILNGFSQPIFGFLFGEISK